MRIVVLGGAGIIGRVIVRDLVEGENVSQVTVADLDLEGARRAVELVGSPKAEAVYCDVTDHAELVKMLRGAAAVVNSAQYYFNVEVMKACLEAHVPYMDLGGLFHLTRKQMQLDAAYREAGLLAILGLGSCPGIANIHAGYIGQQLDTVDYIRIYNGSTPDEGDSLAWAYSLQTILDEITKNPVIFRDGQFVELAPLSEKEFFPFREPIGMAKVHHSIHSEMATIPLSLAGQGIQECFFKITFWGYSEAAVEKMALLASLGLADTEEVEVKGVRVRPRDVLMAVLGRSKATERKGSKGFKDIATVATGTKDGVAVEMRVDTIAWPHPRWKISGGTVLVGVPPSICAQWIGEGRIAKVGVLPPEQAVDPVPFFRELEKRGGETTVTLTRPV
jgi:saccharopine dehydrogenase-like NADP-dependent oxidoreductase